MKNPACEAVFDVMKRGKRRRIGARSRESDGGDGQRNELMNYRSEGDGDFTWVEFQDGCCKGDDDEVMGARARRSMPPIRTTRIGMIRLMRGRLVTRFFRKKPKLSFRKLRWSGLHDRI